MVDEVVPVLPPVLETRAQVAKLLGLAVAQMTFWLYAVPASRRYAAFELQKRNTKGTRTILAPIPPIKAMQARLLAALQPIYRPPRSAHGYVIGRSTKTNAVVHQRRRWILRVDLEDFFPSINFGRVRGLFLKPPFDYMPDVATVLAHICCHENALPQGAPTSPLLSNLICKRLDRRLAELAVELKCRYSRYCDDLTFSSDRRSVPESLGQVDPMSGRFSAGSALERIILEEGFRLNSGKTRLMWPHNRKIVTGIVVNTRLNVPRRRMRSMRSLLYIWRRFGAEAGASSLERYEVANRPPEKPPAEFRLVARGKLQWIGFVRGWNDQAYRRLAGRLRLCDETFVPTRAPDLPVTAVTIFPEGPTDALHLKAAHAWFRSSGEFAELDLQVVPAQKGGDSALLKRCRSHGDHAQPSLQVFIFDGDSKRRSQVINEEGQPKRWSNEVYSCILPPPAFRPSNEPVCIELLYPDAVLERRDPQGRRIYRAGEFDSETGAHETEPVRCDHPEKRVLIRDEGVTDIGGRTVALSKAAFARCIQERMHPFESVEFEGFRGFFELIRSICKKYNEG